MKFEIVVRALDDRYESIFAEKIIREGAPADTDFASELSTAVARMVDNVVAKVEQQQ